MKKPERAKGCQDRIWAEQFDREAVVLDDHIGMAKKAMINPAERNKLLGRYRSSHMIYYTDRNSDEKDAYGVCVIYFKGGSLAREYVGYGQRRRLRWATKEEAQEARASLQLPSPLDFL